ncbi:MAG: hypothetical protein GYB64_19245 [Chloroflexi bacterium]|nr:hypothetical protein [Chloroflexota bacterium]
MIRAIKALALIVFLMIVAGCTSTQPATTVEVTGFSLLNTETGEVITTLNTNDTIAFGDLPASVTIRADVAGGDPLYVAFALDTIGELRFDREAPFDLPGTEWVPQPGSYTLTATPYTETDAGVPLAVQFEIGTATTVEEDIAALLAQIPADTPTATPQPGSSEGSGTPGGIATPGGNEGEQAGEGQSEAAGANPDRPVPQGEPGVPPSDPLTSFSLPTAAEIEGGVTRIPRLSINPNANWRTQATVAYFYYLRTRDNNRVIAGQFGSYGEGAGVPHAVDRITKIHQQTGKVPALTGMDYHNWDIANANNYNQPNAYLREFYNRNGLVTVSWHAPNPWTGGPSTDHQSGNPRDVSDLLQEGTQVHQRWMLLLDDVADGLQQLEDQGVVVIWRPFHEMNGGWFWWHEQEPDDFVALWRHMVRYFTVERGLNNLIWAYSPNTNNNQWNRGSMHYYPGDQWVDLVGLDHYRPLDEDPILLDEFNEYSDLKTTGKPMALFEFGPSPANSWPDRPTYDYSRLIRDIRNLYPRIVMFQAWEWHWAIGEHANASGLMNDPWIVTLDEMPNWQQIPAGD